jgi:hypothetical protein
MASAKIGDELLAKPALFHLPWPHAGAKPV